MEHGARYTKRARVLFCALGLLGAVFQVPGPVAGAPAAGFLLGASQASPVSGAVTISAPGVGPEAGLLGVQFKLDGYVLEAVDTTAPFEVLWSAASASDGEHTITAEARYASGMIIESAPLALVVANLTAVNLTAVDRTLHVDAGAGNDANNGLTPGTAWRTLGRANGAAVAGDTVRLRGTFSGQQIAPSGSGTAAQPIRFTSYFGETAVLNGGLSGTAVALDGRSYIVVEGLRIQNGSGNAVTMTGGAHHNVLRGSTITDTGGAWATSVRIVRGSDNLVEENEILNNGSEASNSGDSIWISDGSSRNRLLNNTLRNGGHSLMMIGGDRAGEAEVGDNVVAGNTMSNFYTTPIILSWMARRTLVEHNRISDGARNGVNYPRPGIQIQSREHIIRYNEVFNNAGPGIQLSGYVYNTIAQDSIGNRIYHNVFYGNGTYGLWIAEKQGRVVRDNLIANNIFFRNSGGAVGGQSYTIGIEHYHTTTAWPVGDLGGNRVENNIVLRQPGAAGEPAVLRIRNSGQGGNLAYSLGQFQATYPEARNNLEVDPLFTDEAKRVFTLRSGSQAIDRGLLLAGVAYLGTAPDVGAFEYAGLGGDTTAPTVSLDSPGAGQEVSGVVTVGATAADNVGVTRIDYLQDGQVLAVASPPVFTVAWDTTRVSNGGHSLSTRAYDAAGNVGTSAAVGVTVANPSPGPVLTGLSPASGPAGSGALTLTVNGSGFVPASVVRWNGNGRPTTFVSATQLQAAISASDIATAGSAAVTVYTPAPGGGTSAALTFTITASNPVPVPIATDGFESRGFSGGIGWNGPWARSGDVGVRTNTDGPQEGMSHVRLRQSTGLLQRGVNLSGAQNVRVTFWAKVASFEGSDRALVQVSPDGVTFTTVKAFTGADSTNTYRYYDVDLSAFPMTANFSIAFNAEMSSSGDYWFVDNIRITGVRPSP